MPINVPKDLPAVEILTKENIFAFTPQRARQQDIRPLKILIANLMPQKITTEIQLLRLLSQSPLQLDVTFLKMRHHASKTTSASHLDTFYQEFSAVKAANFDALIITGAPVEKMAFDHVDYWQELTTVMEWSKSHCTSVLHICWGAQAGLFYHYGIDKVLQPEKIFGIFPQQVELADRLVAGFDDLFYMPHSRYTGIETEKLTPAGLNVIATGEVTGPSIICSADRKQLFVLGHFEYQTETLQVEYERDQEKGIATAAPENYFVADGKIFNRWRAHATLFFMNWINDVYQVTPYDWC